MTPEKSFLITIFSGIPRQYILIHFKLLRLKNKVEVYNNPHQVQLSNSSYTLEEVVTHYWCKLQIAENRFALSEMALLLVSYVSHTAQAQI